MGINVWGCSTSCHIAGIDVTAYAFTFDRWLKTPAVTSQGVATLATALKPTGISVAAVVCHMWFGVHLLFKCQPNKNRAWDISSQREASSHFLFSPSADTDLKNMLHSDLQHIHLWSRSSYRRVNRGIEGAVMRARQLHDTWTVQHQVRAQQYLSHQFRE